MGLEDQSGITLHTVFKCIVQFLYLRNELKGVKRTEKGVTLTLQETWSIHDSMNRPKIESIAYIHFLL